MPPNVERPAALYTASPPSSESGEDASVPERKRIIIAGLGMVAASFMEKLLEYGPDKYQIRVFSEEPEVAYNRVGLTQYFSHLDVERQLMLPRSWYAENNIQVDLADPIEEIDTVNKRVRARQQGWIDYDICVLATGSSAALPPNVNPDKYSGVFVYRTLQDLNDMVAWSRQEHVKHAAVVGGGLLGLEAAKAAMDLGLETTLYERADRLMSRQLDCDASRVLEAEISKLGIKTVIGDYPVELQGSDEDGPIPGKPAIRTMRLSNDQIVETQMVIYAIGVRPRDQLSQPGSLERAPRGGFVVNERMETTAQDVYAIGECASFLDTTYGLVAPGYDMAEIVARNLTTRLDDRRKAAFKGADMSTKLKLLGVHVASFGDCFPDEVNTQPLVYRDPFSGIYKKYIFTKDGKKLIGGMMVGDTNDYAKLLALVRSAKRLTSPPSELILGVKGDDKIQGADALPDDTQICSCNNVTKGAIRKVIREKKCENVNQVKIFSKAGTGCGGCLPQVQEIFEAELTALGRSVSNSLCTHFKFSRPELFTIGQVKQLRSFEDYCVHAGLPRDHQGCEVCKPAIASILAGLWNEHILNPALRPLQDTNDRYLANIQRGGLYSVVPRIAAGEVTPEKLRVIADVAKEYNLYTKITGAQRIDIMGARKQDLPDIWEKLVDAGFESGHAYGKSLRAVKSCVGTTWCRYGQQDSVGFAIMLENRYKGIRSPHKLKGGVSGCIRECAEAQGKDFGCIATDKGYNLYVCGNGGSKPKHAELLVADVSEELVIRYLDRFLMYYIMTADKLTRTARWLEKLAGGIQYLRKVVVEDYLGIAAQLEAHMHQLISSYQCEWTTVIRDPVKRKHFEEFINADAGEGDAPIEMVSERGQNHPAWWPKEVDPLEPLEATQNRDWLQVGSADLFPEGEGKVVKVGEAQIAVFRVNQSWYATQNMCPHKRALVLSSGILGSAQETNKPYVSCPMHKKNFDLASGDCLVPGEKEKYKLETFAIKVEDNQVYLRIPSIQALNKALGSKKTIIKRGMAKKVSPPLLVPEVVSFEQAPACGTGGGCGDKSLDW
ncbi:nitrite reductase NiiA [Dichotomocladium elegans]|nr:nitrite reductase NiiA [Dichotomocladium elegans]